MNTLYINNHKPQADKFYTDKLGVQQCINRIKGEYEQIMREEAVEYVKGIFSKLAEYDYNPDLMRLYVVGGGGCLVKNFGQYDPAGVEILSDICATAKGYEIAAYNSLERERKLGNCPLLPDRNKAWGR